MKSRRAFLKIAIPASITAPNSSSAETTQSAPSESPTFPSHGIEISLQFNGVGNIVVVLKNEGGTDVKIWAPHRGPGEYAYRFEIRIPSAFHFLLLPKAKNRDYNPMEFITVKAGGTSEFKVNLQDGEWRIPKNLPVPLVGCQMRTWYKPGNLVFEKKAACSLGVTLDTFVGDWTAVPAWPELIEGKNGQ